MRRVAEELSGCSRRHPRIAAFEYLMQFRRIETAQGVLGRPDEIHEFALREGDEDALRLSQ
jgi:hypothetical protein